MNWTVGQAILTNNCEIPATPISSTSTTVTAIHNAAGGVITTATANAGDTVHDSATVSASTGATPTGTVTFKWFTNGTCRGEVPAATSGALALSATGTVDATGFAQGPLNAGSYSFQAIYSGDNNHTGSNSPCEPLTVGQLSSTSTTVTAIHNTADAVITTANVGDTVHDKATVSASTGATPTGTVTFKWFTNGGCTGSPAATSSPFTLVSGAVDATTFPQTPASAGTTYSFQATYVNTNTNNTLPGSTSPCEALTVNQPPAPPAPPAPIIIPSIITPSIITPSIITPSIITPSIITPVIAPVIPPVIPPVIAPVIPPVIPPVLPPIIIPPIIEPPAAPNGAVTVIKHVINTAGGTKTAADFTVHVKLNGSDVAGSPKAGSETGTAYTLNPGSYTISEDTPAAGYVQLSITCDGASTATFTVSGAGDAHTCTITNQATTNQATTNQATPPVPAPPKSGNSAPAATAVSTWWVLLALLGSLALSGTAAAELVRRLRRA